MKMWNRIEVDDAKKIVDIEDGLHHHPLLLPRR
jgi:hypothetical protein